MPQAPTNPKIEELRFRLKTDPKSRLFYQLAEELRKAGDFAEAERVLRAGLENNPTYLAAWVSLGRVLRERKDDGAAVDALMRAMQLDPANVVAARLLADSYLALGEKVEAVKKYKLVHAMMPGDDEVTAAIARLERELQPLEAGQPEPDREPPFEAATPAEPEPFSAPEAAAVDREPESESSTVPAEAEESAAATTSPAEPDRAPDTAEESPFDEADSPFEEAARSLDEELRVESETGDTEPMHRTHDESPFEDPVGGFTSAAVEIEAAPGIHVAAAPAAADVAAPPLEELPSVVAPALPEPFATGRDTGAPEDADAANTLTMADLYAGQGLVEQARTIYERILARDPGNAAVRAKLDGLASRANPKIATLERWLAKVSRREVGGV